MAAKISESPSFPEDSDVLMIDRPFLEYINGLLMDEDMDDASYPQQLDGPASYTSYQAIFSSLQDIIADTASVSQDRDEFANVDGKPIYQAMFSSLKDIKQLSDSAPSASHPPTKPTQQEISRPASTLPTTITGLSTDSTNRRYSSCLSEKDAVAPNYVRVLESSHDELLTGAMASCLGKDGAAQGRKGQDQGKAAVAQGHKGQEQGNGTLIKPSASTDEQFLSDQVTALGLSIEDLKLDDVYTSLYVDGGPSSPTIVSRNGRQKQKSTAGKDTFCKKQTSKASVFLDVREMLISCAEAVAIGNVRRANWTLQEIDKVCGASAHGTGLQRIAYIFSRALAARMRGAGVQELEAMSRDMPSSATLLQAAKLEFEVMPYKKLVHFYANQRIFQAAEGALRLHILDYGVEFGLQWPCLIIALANRKGGPPLLVITFIEFPQAGLDMAGRLDETGRRLAAYAKTYNVPFQHHVVVSDKWENLDAASLQLCSDQPQVLVVNCMNHLRHVADDTTTSGESTTASARQKLLALWHSLNPHLLVTTVVNGAHSSPFFVTRFRETSDFFTSAFDMLDTVWGDSPERFIVERGFCYPYIMNIVACEGAERVERSQTYRQWHTLITKAGFEQVPTPSTVLAKAKSHVRQHHHQDFLICDDEKGWMLVGWKGRAVLAISAWKLA